MEKISVIIPVFNGRTFLAGAIESALEQDYHPFEVVVVDDGSSDGSGDIAESYSEVRLIEHEKNRGLPAARNSGIKAAQGQYVAFLDADDTWPQHKLSCQLEFHTNHPEHKFSFTLERFVFDDPNNAPNWTRKKVFQQDHPAFCGGSMMFETSIFEEVGLFNEQLGNEYADAEWIIRAKDKGHTGGIVQELLLFRRIHSENLSERCEHENHKLLRSLKKSIEFQRRKV